MKVLVTGFEPFGGEMINPAQKAVESLPNTIDGATIIKLIIPTVRYKATELIEKAIQVEKPDIVISIGQAGGRFAITPELVAINFDDFAIADNAGNQPHNEPIQADGAPAYFATLPLQAIVTALRQQNIPAERSTTAGTFVCNHVFYGVSYFLAKNYPHIKNGFIHIPYTTSQVLNKRNTPYMSLDDITRGLEIAIQTCIAAK